MLKSKAKISKAKIILMVNNLCCLVDSLTKKWKKDYIIHTKLSKQFLIIDKRISLFVKKSNENIKQIFLK